MTISAGGNTFEIISRNSDGTVNLRRSDGQVFNGLNQQQVALYAPNVDLRQIWPDLNTPVIGGTQVAGSGRLTPEEQALWRQHVLGVPQPSADLVQVYGDRAARFGVDNGGWVNMTTLKPATPDELQAYSNYAADRQSYLSNLGWTPSPQNMPAPGSYTANLPAPTGNRTNPMVDAAGTGYTNRPGTGGGTTPNWTQPTFSNVGFTPNFSSNGFGQQPNFSSSGLLGGNLSQMLGLLNKPGTPWGKY